MRGEGVWWTLELGQQTRHGSSMDVYVQKSKKPIEIEIGTERRVSEFPRKWKKGEEKEGGGRGRSGK